VKKPIILILAILFFDQLIKIYIKTHFFLGEEVAVLGDWFILHFTENNGMAWGLELGGEWGKLVLSVFRILFVAGIGWYLYRLTKEKADTLYIISLSLIFAGAVGNILDSVFYGVIFTDSVYQIATFMPVDGGYSPLLYGKVVDMFYFPLIEGHFPEWFPVWGTEQFIFFRPVFNLADMSISAGVGLIVLFQKRFFDETKNSEIKHMN
jgi:signal peptidase II